MTTTTKDIYLLVNAATCSGRGYMQGVLSEIARQTAWRLHVCDRDTVGYRSLVETIRTNRLDGFITSKLEDPRLEAILQSSDIPLVVIGTRENCLPARIHDIRIVTLNEQKIGVAAARHFLRMGKFAAYGYVHFREEYCQYLSRQRERGFIDELARSASRRKDRARTPAAPQREMRLRCGRNLVGWPSPLNAPTVGRPAPGRRRIAPGRARSPSAPPNCPLILNSPFSILHSQFLVTWNIAETAIWRRFNLPPTTPAFI